MAMTEAATRRQGPAAQNLFAWVALVVVAYLLFIPGGMIVYGSLRSDFRTMTESHWTLANYLAVFGEPAYLYALLNTFIIATGSMLVSVIGGGLLAWITTRTALPFMRTIQLGIVIPFLMSSFIGAVAWTYLAAPRFGLLNHVLSAIGVGWLQFDIYSYGGMVFVSGIYGIPVSYLFLYSAFQSMDYRMEEAAAVTGAGRWRIFRTIVVPLALPTILACALLEFVASAENYAVPALLGDPARIDVLSTMIALDVINAPPKYGEASAASILLMAVVIVGLLGYQKSVGLQKKYVTIGGKGAAAVPKQTGPWPYIGAGLIFLYIFFAVFLPLLVLVVSSFQKYYGQPWFPVALTTKNYISIFTDPQFTQSLVNSLLLAIGGAAICLILGFAVAYLVSRGTHPLRRLIDLLATAPIAFPGVVLGLALLWTYVTFPVPIYGTLAILIIAMVTIRLPYANRFAGATFLRISSDLEEASAVTGSSWTRTARRIVLPLTAPALASAFLIIFIMIMRDISTIILLFSYNTIVLSVLLTNRLLDGIYVEAAAVTVILLLLMLAVWLVASRFLNSPLQAIR